MQLAQPSSLNSGAAHGLMIDVLDDLDGSQKAVWNNKIREDTLLAGSPQHEIYKEEFSIIPVVLCCPLHSCSVAI